MSRFILLTVYFGDGYKQTAVNADYIISFGSADKEMIRNWDVKKKRGPVPVTYIEIVDNKDVCFCSDTFEDLVSMLITRAEK